MNTIETTGRIQAIRCIPGYRTTTYYFLVNGYFCTYSGSKSFKVGELVKISGRANDLGYANHLGQQKTMHGISVTTIKKLLKC